MVAEHEAKALLREAGVPVPRGVVVRGMDFGPVMDLREPLVLKAYGPGIVHKSEAGAVELGLRRADVPAAAARMLAEVVGAEGFLIEEQAAAGVELIVGLVHDPGFGPVLLAGLGGVWAETLRDTALGLCPISEEDARRMLGSLRGSPVLYGLRGRPGVDVDAVVKLLMTVGGAGGLWERLELGEFEINPVIATESGVVAVDARYLPASPTVLELVETGEPADFGPLFEPKAVAVVGASTSRPNFGNMFLEFYKAAGVPLVAVHPEAREVGGVPAVHSLAAADVDYALVAVPAERCAEVVRQAAGVPYVQVMSGGFGEAGRPELEQELVAAARAAGTRLLGPNCMGVYCPRGRQTFVGGGLGPAGTVALISQSGGLAGEVIKVGERRGLAFSRVVTVGNAADVTPAELLRWLSADPETRAIGLYLEDPRDGRALYEALAAAPVPVVLLVGGRSAQGQRAAASHTGGLVSDGRIWQALADQTGATLVTSQDDLIGVLAFFQAHGTRTTGPHDGTATTDGRAGPYDGTATTDGQAGSLGVVPGGEVGAPSAIPGDQAGAPGAIPLAQTGTPGAVSGGEVGAPSAIPRDQTGALGAVPGNQAGALGVVPGGAAGSLSVGARGGALVIGPSGGASVLAADVFDRAGVPLGPLPDAVLGELRGLGLGAGSSLANPLEVPVGPRSGPDLVRRAVEAIVRHQPYPDVVAHVNVQSFFTYGTRAEPLFEYARALAATQDALPGTRVTLVTRNGECAPPGVEDEVRAIVAAAGIPVYRSMEAASVAVAAGGRNGTA
ncbi:acetate--CoA ligase family protein [Nonomuraea guangzhouensis]|uniref:Acetate--CoA ligase family protein n=1 Tax=Nonomuraea guangzhouensis TaxID=1291555 RepID=A0ABW4GWP2_9ACTN|nr:acetate--CoA ligase family protein [Nonomuraea guangzhouensis]